MTNPYFDRAALEPPPGPKLVICTWLNIEGVQNTDLGLGTIGSEYRTIIPNSGGPLLTEMPALSEKRTYNRQIMELSSQKEG
jgi:hypothetical protein